MARALAPHVDVTWAEMFIVELRLLGIAGDRIGAALTEVESHCSESGQGAEHAFGSPVEYARSLQLPVDDDHSPQAVLRSLVPIMVQVSGMSLLIGSFDAWLRGQRLEITTGHVVVASLTVLAMATVVLRADSVLRTAVYHQIRSVILTFCIYLVGTATFVAALVFLDGTLWHAPAPLGLGAGAALLAGGAGWALARLRNDGPENDLITSPFGGANTSPNGGTGPLRGLFGPSLISILIYAGMIPVGTVLLFAVTLLLHRMTPA